MHEFCSLRTEYLPVLKLAVVEVRDHEIGHVLRSGGDAAGGKCLDEFEGLGLVGSLAIALRHEGFEFGGKRLHKRGALHFQSSEDVFRDVLLEWFAGDSLHDITCESRGVV